jgi:hypothetical protein
MVFLLATSIFLLFPFIRMLFKKTMKGGF